VKQVSILILVHVISFTLNGQIINTFELGSPASDAGLPLSNSASVAVHDRGMLWFGTARGLSRTTNSGQTWTHFAGVPPFDYKGISAIATRGDTVWVAIGYSERRDGSTIQIGGGLHVSTDRGNAWSYVKQPMDSGTVDTLTYGINKIRALAVTVPEQNITFDIALTRNTVWITSFGGMFRKSTDHGRTWHRVILPPDGPIDRIAPTDTLNFDLSPSSGRLGLQENLNHIAFSVYASSDSTIWVGTSGGINKSTDGGISWRKFTAQNQLKPISGNWVVAINEQVLSGKRILWAATVNTRDANERQGVSFTSDGGETWSTTLLGERAHNIAFRDSIVYVATNNGLFRSADIGKTWIRSGSIVDLNTRQRFAYRTTYAVATKGDTLWMSGTEGIAYTVDHPSTPFGSLWKIFRTYEPVGSSGRTYAYPTPFSPDDEVVRIHYSTSGKTAPVTIRVFDFAMIPVRTIIENAVRSGDLEHDELWNGKDDFNRRVANGVYFYRVDIENKDSIWGKIHVVQ